MSLSSRQSQDAGNSTRLAYTLLESIWRDLCVRSGLANRDGPVPPLSHQLLLEAPERLFNEAVLNVANPSIHSRMQADLDPALFSASTADLYSSGSSLSGPVSSSAESRFSFSADTASIMSTARTTILTPVVTASDEDVVQPAEIPTIALESTLLQHSVTMFVLTLHFTSSLLAHCFKSTSSLQGTAAHTQSESARKPNSSHARVGY